MSGPSRETRRSPRILARIPILIAGEGPLYNAVTAVVNCHGALLLTPVEYLDGAIVEVQNLSSGALAKCRVVWQGGEERPGTYKTGVELLDEQLDFWGVDYSVGEPAPPQPPPG